MAPDLHHAHHLIETTWAPDYRAEFPALVASFVAAGASRPEAELRAFGEWNEPALAAALADARLARAARLAALLAALLAVFAP